MWLLFGLALNPSKHHVNAHDHPSALARLTDPALRLHRRAQASIMSKPLTPYKRLQQRCKAAGLPANKSSAVLTQLLADHGHHDQVRPLQTIHMGPGVPVCAVIYTLQCTWSRQASLAQVAAASLSVQGAAAFFMLNSDVVLASFAYALQSASSVMAERSVSQNLVVHVLELVLI